MQGQRVMSGSGQVARLRGYDRCFYILLDSSAAWQLVFNSFLIVMHPHLVLCCEYRVSMTARGDNGAVVAACCCFVL